MYRRHRLSDAIPSLLRSKALSDVRVRCLRKRAKKISELAHEASISQEKLSPVAARDAKKSISKQKYQNNPFWSVCLFIFLQQRCT